MSIIFYQIIYFVYKFHFFLCKCHKIWYNIIERCDTLKHCSGYVYDLYYHIVWCVKYRHKILVNEIKNDFIDNIKKYIKNQGEEDAKRDKDKIISK